TPSRGGRAEAVREGGLPATLPPLGVCPGQATEFRECDLTGARLSGVVMQDAVIDGLITNLVVNGVEVTEYVEAERDRRHPVRVLIRSEDPADLREASRQLQAGWAATIERIRRTPGIERRSVNEEWSAVRTMRHLVFVHDSWFRRCCLGSTELFTPMGIGTTVEPYRGAHGLDLSLDPALDDIVSVRDAQAAELEAWLDEVTAVQLAARAPVPNDDVWPPYARGRSVRQCLGTVLNETFAHHGSASATSTSSRHRTLSRAGYGLSILRMRASLTVCAVPRCWTRYFSSIRRA
ncbi:DinB family protein, partial [Streptomyces sp. NPDC057654]|uniref:DinB family protein n=1 Tax=Streptomyces sp. NPDC057654 TaxID=3346196 RepID=UPI00369110F7